MWRGTALAGSIRTAHLPDHIRSILSPEYFSIYNGFSGLSPGEPVPYFICESMGIGFSQDIFSNVWFLKMLIVFEFYVCPFSRPDGFFIDTPAFIIGKEPAFSFGPE